MSTSYKVVITDFISDDLQPEKNILGDLADVTALHAQCEQELVGKLEDADAIMLYHDLSLSGRILHRLGNCKLIVRCGVGYDNVDAGLARRLGIPVANVPDYGTEEVADSALALTLTLCRGSQQLNSQLRSGTGPWSYTQAVPRYRLRGRTFGIIGLGRIGTAAALRAKAFGLRVLFHDPYKPSGFDKSLGVQRASTIKELLSQSDIVSLHCPLTDDTRHLIDARSIEWMPAGGYLINTARGEVVDTERLPEWIASGRLAGAGIDVLEREPPPVDHPLIRAWRDPGHPAHHRVIINPHSAFYSEEGLLDMRVKGARACRQALLGERIDNVVNGVVCDAPFPLDIAMELGHPHQDGHPHFDGRPEVDVHAHITTMPIRSGIRKEEP